jgi:hypothetical protein
MVPIASGNLLVPIFECAKEVRVAEARSFNVKGAPEQRKRGSSK